MTDNCPPQRHRSSERSINLHFVLKSEIRLLFPAAPPQKGFLRSPSRALFVIFQTIVQRLFVELVEFILPWYGFGVADLGGDEVNGLAATGDGSADVPVAGG